MNIYSNNKFDERMILIVRILRGNETKAKFYKDEYKNELGNVN